MKRCVKRVAGRGNVPDARSRSFRQEVGPHSATCAGALPPGIWAISRDPTLALRKELVLFNDRGHCHFAVCAAVFDADYASFALYSDTLC
jgi:hypothetical protein